MSDGPSSRKELTIQEVHEAVDGRYEILEVIGKGGMGVVYKARQSQLERLVAIKVLAMPDDGGEMESEFGFHRRFEQEARAMARLSHPHIVAVHDYGETQSGVHFIVMEYVDGSDFHKFVQSGKLTPEHTLVWGRQICDALAYAHSHNMVHRDIKPGNILIDRQGKVRIADFGLVKVMGSNALDTQKAFGSVGYVAPEVLENAGDVDARVDIYSFGVLLYQMLTGQIPWGLWDAPSQRIPGLDPRFDQVVERALQPKPDDRYQTIADLKQDLDEIAFSTPDGLSASKPLAHKVLLWRLAAVFAVLFVASSVGSLFNIYFNENQIGALLEGAGGQEQRIAFQEIIGRWNATAYPIFTLIWAGIVFSLCQLPQNSDTAKRRVVNLPWWGVIIGGIGWVLSIPGLLIPMIGMSVPPSVWVLLPLSVLVSAGIALSQGFLAVDMLAQRLLYPHFFAHHERPWETPGAYVLSLQGRGFLWTLSSSVCPILALLLLVITTSGDTFFTTTVSALCVVFGLVGVWLFGRMVVQPVEEFREASAEIQKGNLNVRVETNRADEFGQLASEFNRMTAGLREKEQLRESVHRASSGKLAQDMFREPTEAGYREVQAAVMMLGVEDEGLNPAEQALAKRNRFRDWAVVIIQNHGGRILSLAGMRLLVVFVADDKGGHPSAKALAAAQELLERFPNTKGTGERALGELRVGIDFGLVALPKDEELPDVLGKPVEAANRIYVTACQKEVGLLLSAAAYENGQSDLAVREVCGEKEERLLTPE